MTQDLTVNLDAGDDLYAAFGPQSDEAIEGSPKDGWRVRHG